MNIIDRQKIIKELIDRSHGEYTPEAIGVTLFNFVNEGRYNITEQDAINIICSYDMLYEAITRPKKPKTSNKKKSDNKRLSKAGQQAQKMGLKYVGYAKYADKQGKIVAKSVDGKLVKIKPGEENQKKKNNSVKSQTNSTSSSDLDIQSDAFEKINKDNFLSKRINLDSLKNLNVCFPNKYFELLARLANTKINEKTKNMSYFTKQNVGAGIISSQTGEIMTMIFSSLPDEQFKELSGQLLQHCENIKNEKSIITKDWVQAAIKNRNAIFKSITSEFPEGTSIIQSAWDTKEEIKHLGLDPSEKGASSDVYFKVLLPDKTTHIIQVSLKKSAQVNLLNTGISSFLKWDPKLGDDINPKIYSKNQENLLDKYVRSNIKLLDKLLKNPSTKEDQKLMQVMKSKKVDNIRSTLEKKNKNRGDKKVLLHSLIALSSHNKKMNIILKKISDNSDNFAERCKQGLMKNKKLKNGLLKEISEQFPLKDASTNKEIIIIGDLSLNKTVFKKVFGVDSYDEVINNLIIKKGPPSYIVYNAKLLKKVVPISIIDIREDGKGYGGAKIRFDMKLHKKFAELIKQANDEIYNAI